MITVDIHGVRFAMSLRFGREPEDPDEPAQRQGDVYANIERATHEPHDRAELDSRGMTPRRIGY